MIFGGVDAMMMMMIPMTNDASASIASFATAWSTMPPSTTPPPTAAMMTILLLLFLLFLLLLLAVVVLLLVVVVLVMVVEVAIVMLRRRRRTPHQCGHPISIPRPWPHRAAAGVGEGGIRDRLRGADPRGNVVRGGVHGDWPNLVFGTGRGCG